MDLQTNRPEPRAGHLPDQRCQGAPEVYRGESGGPEAPLQATTAEDCTEVH